MIDLRAIIRTLTGRAVTGVLLAAAAVMVTGCVIGDFQLFCAGLTGWLVAATFYLSGRSTITAQVLERERQAGYTAGFVAGRRVAKPVLLRGHSAEGSPSLKVDITAASGE